MKGDIAMRKLDLISDEYIREAEIPEELRVIPREKQGFWQKLSLAVNAPLGVAMLCAVISLSVLAALVAGLTGRWGQPGGPGGSPAESLSEESHSGSTEIPHTEIPPTIDPILPEGTEFKLTYTKDHVAEFYQALIDLNMMGMIPNYDEEGELTTTEYPDFFFEEEYIYNVTPAAVYEATGARIFYTGFLTCVWHEGDIHVLNHLQGIGHSFFSAVPCDYDLNGIPDILYTYACHLSGRWGATTVGIYDTGLQQVLPAVSTGGVPALPLCIAESPAVIYPMDRGDREVYGVYAARQSSTSKIESIYTSEELIYILQPSGQGLQVIFPHEEPEPVIPIPDIQQIPELVPTVFSQYLQTHGFVGGLSEGDFIQNVLGRFAYEGQPLHEMPMVAGSGALADGGFMGTLLYEGECKDFDFSHSSIFPTNGNDRYSYRFSTRTALEGFSLPHGMMFGDTFGEVMEKLSLPELNFTPGATVLYRVGGETLMLIWEDISADFSFLLVFKDTQTTDVSPDLTMSVTRMLTLTFGHDTQLFEVLLQVDTQYTALANPGVATQPPTILT